MDDLRPRRSRLGLVGWLLIALSPISAWVIVEPGEAGVMPVMPAWMPPWWAMIVAWAGLDAVAGVAAWDLWRERGFRHARVSLGLLLVLQLVLNPVWPWLFFGQLRLAGTVLIILITILGLALSLMFGVQRRTAGWLMLVYAAGAAYTTSVAVGVLVLN